MSDVSDPTALDRKLALLRRDARRQGLRLGALLAGILGLGIALTLSAGQTFVPPLDVIRVLIGEDVPGAGFTVGTLRLPRVVLAVLAGISFGLSGAAFQTLLRNPLASPDIVGITAGGSTAAVFAIVILGWTGSAISFFALGVGLAVAALIYALSWRGGMAGTRLILVGIGISAMLDSFSAYILTQAPAWTLQDAMRWLTGSINGARLEQSSLLVVSVALFGSLLLTQTRNLQTMRLGDDKAAALGVRLGRTRLVVTLCATGLIAFATAVTGPIAFVSFLSGPIAARVVGQGRPLLIPAALVGAALVLFADFSGQFLLPARYPVGIVTGVLGAPYLIYLIIRSNRTGTL